MPVASTLVAPGDRLCRVSDFTPGPGTYKRGVNVYASVIGVVVKEEVGGNINSKKNGDIEKNMEERREAPQTLPLVYVKAMKSTQDQVIEVGDLILGRVTKVRSQLAFIEIICVGEVVLRESAAGVVRKEDVRLRNRGSVVMGECFRPGDIVRAKIISLGDTRQYIVSTADAELGVSL